MASAGGDGGESLSLNLTPMLDIFSILVTFLLMSYSTDPTQHDVDGNLELPESITIASMDEVPAVIINRKEILVNNKSLVTLESGKIPAAELNQGAINSVYKALVEIQEANKLAAKELASATDDKKSKPPQITVEMDKSHNFELMRRIMLSGQQAEFLTFKLLTSKPTID